MKSVKSERLKKFEAELHDLQEWQRLGLVPKKDIEKHKEEIKTLQTKISEEKERLQFVKEGGDAEEFVIPKRAPAKGAYNEMPTIPDVEAHETNSGLTEGFEATTYGTDESTYEDETEEYYTTGREEEAEQAAAGGEAEEDEEDEEDESYFSERSRWRRGGIVDPDADQW